MNEWSSNLSPVEEGNKVSDGDLLKIWEVPMITTSLFPNQSFDNLFYNAAWDVKLWFACLEGVAD